MNDSQLFYPITQTALTICAMVWLIRGKWYAFKRGLIGLTYFAYLASSLVTTALLFTVFTWVAVEKVTPGNPSWFGTSFLALFLLWTLTLLPCCPLAVTCTFLYRKLTAARRTDVVGCGSHSPLPAGVVKEQTKSSDLAKMALMTLLGAGVYAVIGLISYNAKLTAEEDGPYLRDLRPRMNGY